MLPGPRVSTVSCGLAILALSVGCAQRTTRPPITDIRLTLSATPEVAGPSHPATLEAKVVNAGETRVWHCQGCGCGNGIALVVLGPDGEAVELLDPNRPRTLCADGPAALEPGARLEERLVFTGTLYERGHPGSPSPTYPAPPGIYTVVASFTSGTAWNSGDLSLGERTTFHWQP